MSSPYFSELYNKKILFYKIIWLVLTSQGFFFAGVIFFNGKLVQGTKIADPNIESALTVGALLLAITSCSLRKFLLSNKKIKSTINTTIHSEDLVKLTQYHGNFKQLLLKVETLSDYEKRAINLTHYAFIPYLISWIMNEAILLIGVIISINFENPYKIIPFALTHLTLNIFMFPDINKLLVRAKSFYRES